MSWVAESYIGPHYAYYFRNFGLAYTNIIYRGYGSDQGLFRYYLTNYGYIFADSFLPYKIFIDNQLCETDFICYSNYYRYYNSSYFLYYCKSLGEFIIIPRQFSGYSGFGIQPVTYYYEDENGYQKTTGTAYYSGNLNIGNNKFTGHNEFKGKSLTVKIEQNFFKNESSSTTGEYIHTLDSSKKILFGIPTYNISLGLGILYKKTNIDNDAVLFENVEKTIQFKRVDNKLVYGTQNSESGWWQCNIPENRTDFTLKFKKPTNSTATGDDITCTYTGLTNPYDFQKKEAYYGDLMRWI